VLIDRLLEGVRRCCVPGEVLREMTHQIQAGLLIQREQLRQKQMDPPAKHRVLRLGQTFQQIVAHPQQIVLHTRVERLLY